MPTSLRTVDVNKIELTDLSVTTGAAGASALAYDNTTGGFTFTPVNMGGLTDVDTTGVTNGQTLLYDSGTSSWIVGDSVGGLSAANTETHDVKSTLSYDSGTGTFTFDFGNNFMTNGLSSKNLYCFGQNFELHGDQEVALVGGPTGSTCDISLAYAGGGSIRIRPYSYTHILGTELAVTSHVVPRAMDGFTPEPNLFDLGDSVSVWRNVYARTINSDASLALTSSTGFVNVNASISLEGDLRAADADSYSIGTSGTRFLEAYVGTIDATTANLGATTVAGNVIPSADVTYDLGSATNKWKTLYANGSTFGNVEVGVDPQFGSGANTIRTISGSTQDLKLETDTGEIILDGNVTVDGAIIPQVANNLNIGAPGSAWDNIWVNTGNFSGIVTMYRGIINDTLAVTGATTLSSTLGVTGLSTLTGGAVASGEINVGVTASNEIDTVSANLILDSATGLTQVDDDLQVTGSLTVTGDLTINGTSTTVNSTTITVDDPVFTLGGDTAPASNDALDKGIEFKWHDGSAAKVGFFGYDESAAKFTFIADATNTSETFAGTAGDVAFGAGSFTTVTASTSLGVGSDWTVALSGANLQFLYQGTVVAQIDSTGQIDAKQDVIADSTAI